MKISSEVFVIMKFCDIYIIIYPHNNYFSITVSNIIVDFLFFLHSDDILTRQFFLYYDRIIGD